MLAVGANPDCEHAANAINENTVSLYKVAKKFYLHYLSPSQVSQPANIQRSYLYVFETSNYSSYHFISVCTAGFTVASMNQTGGRIALYVVALQTLMPRLYGDFNFLGKSETAADAANAINENTVRPYEVAKKFYLHYLTPSQVSQPANIERSYLYVFETSNFSSYHFISVCTAGCTVSSLNQTGGRIALYVAALQKLMPRLYGDFKFLGKSKTAAECMQASNLVNTANATVLTLLGTHHFPGVKSVGLFEALEKGDDSLTYLYVFRNKMWNETTQWWI
ncbi:unnamed protein product [Polarella glacialis]|uniref:Uncharacterized protein n=1 Tax=Polarella glacialis TaxID=89957 RepID=A0A813LZ94_POLGL|nr:unnamed protein product [Polarella glacialis]